MTTHPTPRHRCATLVFAALLSPVLAACGGGDAPGAGGSAASLTAPEPGGRAQALAFTMAAATPAPTGLSGNISCADWFVADAVIDNLEVPPGTTCQLNGTTVRGSVNVHNGAILLAQQVTVAGSVHGEGAAHVQFTGSGSRIVGSLQLEGGGSATVTGVNVGGDMFVNGMSGLIAAVGNQIGGNLQLTQNTGGADVRGNQVKGNLQCTGNLPAPSSADNTAASVQGQCQLPDATGGTGTTPGQPTPPLSGNVTCSGYTLGALRLDSVIVPAGATCALVGTRLNGNLQVGAGARLVADSVTINGGVVADAAEELSLGGTSTVSGSVQVQRGSVATVAGTRVGGSLQIDAMTGPVIAGDNQVAGNLQAHANRGGVNLVGNAVTGAMQCKDNLPAPAGRDNLAGQKQDQCLGL